MKYRRLGSTPRVSDSVLPGFSFLMNPQVLLAQRPALRINYSVSFFIVKTTAVPTTLGFVRIQRNDANEELSIVPAPSRCTIVFAVAARSGQETCQAEKT